ncbi:uncharacterized protein [Leuresthes tenuis]|uniref:uncharacterized protein n=1 Tax=Leuresthes tenuis TaxID=355514 RepID=UPI003B504E2D
MFGGVQDCKNNTGIQIKWTSQDDTPINGDRFRFENPSVCFSKLIITKKPTDHRRKWKCRVAQNDEFKADISDTTAVKDGVEEVFVAVGESVSLTCSNTSSLSFGGRIMRAVETNPLTDISSDSNQKKTVYVSKDTSLVINKLSSLHARDYQCAEFTAQQEVPTKIRLHTLNVIAEAGPSGDNVTLTCVLTCAKECEKDFNLTLSGTQQEQISSQSGLMNVSNTLKRMLFLPVWPRSSDEIVCSVHREGALMASKKWHSPNSLPALVWLGLPLGLLVCAAAVVLYRHMKKKHNKDAANEQCGITMDHVYDVIQDEELQEKREVAAVADGFYDLLQPVN